MPLITPFTNAKPEQMFSKMNRVKMDFRNRLSREQCKSCLRISEEGCDIANYNPYNAIKIWYDGKVRGISLAKPHNYPNKQQWTECAIIDDITDIARYTLSDFWRQWFEWWRKLIFAKSDISLFPETCAIPCTHAGTHTS